MQCVLSSRKSSSISQRLAYAAAACEAASRSRGRLAPYRWRRFSRAFQTSILAPHSAGAEETGARTPKIAHRRLRRRHRHETRTVPWPLEACIDILARCGSLRVGLCCVRSPSSSRARRWGLRARWSVRVGAAALRAAGVRRLRRRAAPPIRVLAHAAPTASRAARPSAVPLPRPMAASRYRCVTRIPRTR
jgi:hypothetical protein